MNIFTPILFFIITWGFGYGATYFWKTEDFWERFFIQVGIGLGVFALLSAVFSIFSIPLDWKLFAGIALLSAGFTYYKNRITPKITIPSLQSVGAIAVSGILLVTFLTGAFSYPYLENDDPWAHALGAKYVAEEKTTLEPSEDENLFFYLDARPPAYDALMGVLLQTTDRVSEVLKVFNSLIIALSIMFFFYLAKLILNSTTKAFFSAAVLAMIPSYFTHFIWGHTLVVALMIVALYCVYRIRESWQWTLPGAISTSGILLTQETQSIKFAVIAFCLLLAIFMQTKRLPWKEALAFAGGAVLSLVWWIPMIFKYGGISSMITWGIEGIPLGAASEAGQKFVHPSIQNIYWGTIGSATRQHGVYTFSDFFIANNTMFNVSIGIGLAAMLLCLVGVVYAILKLRSTHIKTNTKIGLLFILFLFIFTFLGIHGGVHWWSPIGLFSFRFWILFAIPVALLCSEGLHLLQGFFSNRIIKSGLFFIFLVLIYVTSGAHKADLNTSQWGPGGWLKGGSEELSVFLAMQQLPVNTAIYTFTTNFERVVGLDMYSCAWCEADRVYRRTSFADDAAAFNSWLKQNGYEYWIVGSFTYESFGEGEVSAKIEGAVESGFFKIAAQQGPFMLLAVV